MIDLKVSRDIYLFFTVFFNIIKYQRFRNQYKNDSKEKHFYSLNFNNLLTLAIKVEIWFLKKNS